jgi:hypothetical protein
MSSAFHIRTAFLYGRFEIASEKRAQLKTIAANLTQAADTVYLIIYLVVPQFEIQNYRIVTHECVILSDMAKRPRDPSQLAKQVFDIAIGEDTDTVSESKRHPSKRRLGGLKGGKARAKILTAEERRKIARNAARARWKADAMET